MENIVNYELVYELTKQGNIHYHLAISSVLGIDLIIEQLKTIKYFGFTKVQELKSLKDIDNTFNYLLKSWKQSQETIFTAQIYMMPLRKESHILELAHRLTYINKQLKKVKKAKSKDKKKE